MKQLREISEKGREIVSSQRDSLNLFVHAVCNHSTTIFKSTDSCTSQWAEYTR